MFFLMLRAGQHVAATEQLIATLAAAHGMAMVWNGKDAKVKSQTRELIKDANPARI
jgi:hypothetical protein